MKKTLLFAMATVAMTFMSCNETTSTSGKASDNDVAAVVVENIMTRASVRQFTDRKISADTLEQLVKCGMAAPTAVNAQPWSFVIVTERAVLDTLNAHHPWARLETATAAIIVCGDMERALEGPAREYWVQDCSAASENILLAAHAYGLGAVWCGVYHGPESERVPAVCKALNLPEYIIPLNIVTLGYPAQKVEPKDKWKPELVHYNIW